MDLAVAAWLLALLPLSWLAPQRWWTPVCVGVGRVIERLDPRGTATRVEQVSRRRGDHGGLPAPQDIVTGSRAARMERNLQYLRESRPGGWDTRVELSGGEHIDHALADGKGCILWVGPMMYAYLVAKKGLYAAGYSAIHLSHVGHGVSQTRLGHRLNVLRTRPENRYLAERLVMTDGSELKRTRDLYGRLQANVLVSITAEPRWGARMVAAPFLGGEIHLPTGAPSLSLATGATLLPTFAYKRTYDRFEVIIEPALTATRSEDRHAAVDDLVRRYTQRVEQYVTEFPDQYAEWW